MKLSPHRYWFQPQGHYRQPIVHTFFTIPNILVVKFIRIFFHEINNFLFGEIFGNWENSKLNHRFLRKGRLSMQNSFFTQYTTLRFYEVVIAPYDDSYQTNSKSMDEYTNTIETCVCVCGLGDPPLLMTTIKFVRTLKLSIPLALSAYGLTDLRILFFFMVSLYITRWD